jgi:ABC-type cobalamin/Fe3+-siderophores transport system ATPase subunit
MTLMRTLNETMNVTVLMVTHDPALAERYARKSLHMADGKLVADAEALR